MTTIAADILRDYQSRKTTAAADDSGMAERGMAARMLMRKLCEDAKGIRISFSEWVFPDGSQLQV